MRYQSGIRVLWAVSLLVGSLALIGCPRNPELTRGGPGAIGPGAASTPGVTAPGGVAVPGSTAGETPVARPTAPTEESLAGRPAPAGSAAALAAGALKDIFFEYDKAAIPGDQQAALNENARWLKANSRVKITVEGHCDERGTAEYNLGLGDRRARAVRDYLVTAGVAPERVSTISYGKERPFVPGHDESAWKQNRRVHFAVAGQ